MILDCRSHLASWGPIMRKVPTPSGRQSTGFLSPATLCSAGSSATSSTSCCGTGIRTYVNTKTLSPSYCNCVLILNVKDVSLSLFPLLFLQVIKDSMRNKADLTDMSRMWVRIMSSHTVISLIYRIFHITLKIL